MLVCASSPTHDCRHRSLPRTAPHPQYCDVGTLRTAVRRGAFHSGAVLCCGGVASVPAAATQRGVPNVRAMAAALLDVARALHHLHRAACIAHGDIKARQPRTRALPLLCICRLLPAAWPQAEQQMFAACARTAV